MPGISERELRAHFGRRTTTEHTQATETHFVSSDAVRTGRFSRALCGRLVEEDREHANAPTCPTCRERANAIDAMEI
jgi:hypothetical protein